MKLAFVLLAVLILATGCGGQKTASIEEHTTVKDSTVVTFQPKDTIIKVKGETLKVEVPVSDLTEIPLVKKGERAKISISLIDEIIRAECEVADLKKKIQTLQKTIDHYKETETLKTETIIEKVKYVPWLVKMLAWIGGITLLVFGIRFAYKIVKPKFI